MSARTLAVDGAERADDRAGLRRARLSWLIDRFGRAAVAFLFVDAARYHISPRGWISTLSDMTARGVPSPQIMLAFAMFVSTAPALALLFGWKERWAAFGLAIYTICVSAVMYNPFAHLGYTALVLFLKDICIFGALLTLSQSPMGKRWPRAAEPS